MRRLLLPLLACAFVSSGPTAFADPLVPVVASGDAVPGQPGKTFSLSLPTAFPGSDESVVFTALGVWEGDGMGLVLLHEKSQSPPVVPSGLTGSLSELLDIASDQVVLTGFVQGDGVSANDNEAHFASDGQGGLEMLLRENDPAPGLPPGTRMGPPVDRADINSTGGLIVHAWLRETPNATPITASLWAREGYGTPTLLLREGDVVPGIPAAVAPSRGSLNENGDIAVRVVDTGGAEALLVGDVASGLSLLIREGDADPGGLSGTVLSLLCCSYDHPALSAAGLAFTGRLEQGTGGVDESNDVVVFVWDGSGGIQPVAREGEAIPGRPGEFWGSLGHPRINERGEILVENAYSGVQELVLIAPSGQTRLVARTGDPAPGLPPGTTLSGIGAASHPGAPIALSDAGVVSFSAFLPPLTYDGASQQGRFRHSPGSGLHPVVTQGDTVEIRPGEFLTVDEISGGGLDAVGNTTLTLFEIDSEFEVSGAAIALPEPGVPASLSCGLLAMMWLSRRSRANPKSRRRN